MVKEFRKSVTFWQIYRHQYFGGKLFGTHCIERLRPRAAVMCMTDLVGPRGHVAQTFDDFFLFSKKTYFGTAPLIHLWLTALYKCIYLLTYLHIGPFSEVVTIHKGVQLQGVFTPEPHYALTPVICSSLTTWPLNSFPRCVSAFRWGVLVQSAVFLGDTLYA